MKKILGSIAVACALVVAPVIIIGCSGGCTTSQQRKSVNTLFTVGNSVDTAYRSYLDLVIKGDLSTNSVPRVADSYKTFQSAFNAATVLVANSTNAVAPQAVLDAATGVLTTIENVKKGK